MLSRLRRFFDVRGGEGLPVLLSFLYIAAVVAAFLLAKPIRNSLYLRQYGPYSLVYAYAAVPLALSIFVPVYTRIAARFGSRTVTVGTLLFFSANVLMFWYAFRFHAAAEAEEGSALWLLPGIFYVWVNCFGIVAPVQAWSYANSLFDTRQAKRLFGLVGAGASLGAIGGGLLARFLVGPVGGTVNMMLVLAALILLAAGIVMAANLRIRRRTALRAGRSPRRPFVESLRQIRGSRYLSLMAALVFVVAIVTQWTTFQLSLLADARFGEDGDALTAFFGTFNFTLGAITLLLQLLFTGPALRRFGVGTTILLLPVALGLGTTLILLIPVFWTVLLTNGFDQGLRFSIDKATYELLYLPLPPSQRAGVKATIDIVFNRFADAIGAFLLGLATQGFLMVPGLEFGVRGTAAVNLVFISAWILLAWRLRREYVHTIQDTIHRHRIDSERIAAGSIDALTSGVLRMKLAAPDPEEVRHALDLVETQPRKSWGPSVRALLNHPAPDVRRRALAILNAAGETGDAAAAESMLRDRDLGVRTEALLYLSRVRGDDPLQLIEQLGEFPDFSIRASMVAFFAAPGRTQNLDAARALLREMVMSSGPEGIRDRQEAARLLARMPEQFHDLYATLFGDEAVPVARQAIRSAAGLSSETLVRPLVSALGRAEVADDAAEALARYGSGIVGEIGERLRDANTPPAVKRELPQVLLRIGTFDAAQVLIDSLLQPDVTLRHNVIVALNKLQAENRSVRVDPGLLELVLAAEIAGHYRSYQVLGPLRSQLKPDDPMLHALQRSMEQELERIFRVMKLLFPAIALHDAYVGVRSSNPLVRANALEFLENVLTPELRQLLLPLLDSLVTVEERVALADRLAGAPLRNSEQAVATLLASHDAWLRSRAIQAVGSLGLHSLEPELKRLASSAEPAMKEAIEASLQRLAGEAAPEPHRPIPAEMGLDVGAG